jgi:hypothetical protein
MRCSVLESEDSKLKSNTALVGWPSRSNVSGVESANACDKDFALSADDSFGRPRGCGHLMGFVRRSGRIAKEIRILLIGTDTSGHVFAEGVMYAVTNRIRKS